MAKILLISINDFNAEGLRSLSAMLKNNGHQSYIAFLKRYDIGKNAEKDDWTGIDKNGREFRYARGLEISNTEKAILLSLIRNIGPQLIGISVTTPLRKRAAEVSRLIKSSFKIPIVWGGPDPTISVEECLAYCDFVCVGEGEKTIIDIASALDEERDIKEVKNLAYLVDDRVVRNSLYPLIADLDDLPFKDIDKDNKFLIEDDLLVREFNIVSYTKNYRYHLVSARGCPYKCSYCCEDFYKKLYDKQIFLRRRSPFHVVQELKKAKKVIDYKYVQFEDEVFSYDYDWLVEFKDMYKNEINLPFEPYIYPNKDIERQVKILKEIGLVYTCLALQSGSERINREVFNRIFNQELFVKTANLLHSMNVSYYVDIITFNPFEKEKDLQATLGVLKKLPKPFDLCVNKLYVLKGTKIHELIENHREAEKEKAATEGLFIYYSRLFWLASIYSKSIITLIEKIKIFRYFSFLKDCLIALEYYVENYVKHPVNIPSMIKRKIKKLLSRAR